MRFDEETAELLRSLPNCGPVLPYLAKRPAGDRSPNSTNAVLVWESKGVSLHSYRYAWAERPRKQATPNGFAQEALGTTAKAVHRAYARKAKVELPPLGEYEKHRAKFAEAAKSLGPVARAVNA